MNPKTRNIEPFKKLLEERFPGEEWQGLRHQVIAMIKAAANGEAKKGNLLSDFSQLEDLIDVVYSNPILKDKKPGIKEKIKHHKMKYSYWNELQKIGNPEHGVPTAIKKRLAKEFNCEPPTVDKHVYPKPEGLKWTIRKSYAG